ncbi:MAG TPA: BON domain-containing protein [Bryobacteraceae bacterium]|nr:BON domain-containing protein [Bryobacteraceae bacterium]
MKALLPLLLLAAALFGCRTNSTPEQQVRDLQITADVKSKLASDVGLSTVPDISVNSTNGVVTLSGQVDTAAEKAKAESLARGVPHVARVVDDLQVSSSTH